MIDIGFEAAKLVATPQPVLCACCLGGRETAA